MSKIKRVTDDYKRQLRAHERTAEQQLEQAYKHALAAIQPQLDRLYKEMADKLASGEQIPLHWLYEANRLETITRMIDLQLGNFGNTARLTVGQIQHIAANLGSQGAQAQLRASLPRGVTWSFGVPSQEAILSAVGMMQPGSPLHDLFSGFGSDAATAAKHAIITGITTGQSPRDIASQIAQALDVPRWRALTIARTTILSAYRDAALENYRANDDVVQQWVWTAALDRGTCAACIAMNGTLHDLSESMDSHVNCRCVALPQTKSWADILGPLGIDTSGIRETSLNVQSGSDWFDEQPADVQQSILGPAKYQAWSDGQFSLSDLVGVRSSNQWGDSIYEKSLKDLVNA